MENKSSDLAIAALICGILSLVLSCCLAFVALAPAIAGLVLGIISLSKGLGGRGMAIGGVVCSVLTCLLHVLLVITAVGLFTIGVSA